MFSPRVALIFKPVPDHAIRVSYNKAFRSPSLINNFLDVDHHQPDRISRRSIRRLLRAGRDFNFPVHAVGNQDLKRRVDSRPSSSATPGSSASARRVSAAVYFTRTKTRSSSRRRAAIARRTRRPGGSRHCHAASGPGRWDSRSAAAALPVADGAVHDRRRCRRSSAIATSARTATRASSWASTAPSTQALNVFANYSYQAEARSGLRHVGGEPAADEPLQRRLQLQPGSLSGQRRR